MKVSWFKVLAMAGTLADELTKAFADNRVDTLEALIMAKNIAKASGVLVDVEGMDFTEEIIEDLFNAGADGKITIREILAFAEKVCKKLGVEFDKEGFSFE